MTLLTLVSKLCTDFHFPDWSISCLSQSHTQMFGFYHKTVNDGFLHNLYTSLLSDHYRVPHYILQCHKFIASSGKLSFYIEVRSESSPLNRKFVSAFGHFGEEKNYCLSWISNRSWYRTKVRSTYSNQEKALTQNWPDVLTYLRLNFQHTNFHITLKFVVNHRYSNFHIPLIYVL